MNAFASPFGERCHDLLQELMRDAVERFERETGIKVHHARVIWTLDTGYTLHLHRTSVP